MVTIVILWVFKSRNVLPEWKFAWKINICIVSLVYIYRFGGLPPDCALIYYIAALDMFSFFKSECTFLFTQAGPFHVFKNATNFLGSKTNQYIQYVDYCSYADL